MSDKKIEVEVTINGKVEELSFSPTMDVYNQFQDDISDPRTSSTDAMNNFLADSVDSASQKHFRALQKIPSGVSQVCAIVAEDYAPDVKAKRKK